MQNDTLQFGTKPEGEYKNRPCAYVIVVNQDKKLLTLKVGQTFHLPGGGIDADEDPKVAAIRETQEEAGCEITDLQYLGTANQFLLKTKLGPLNKFGMFYRARLVRIDPSKKTEPTHEVHWLEPDEFINLPAAEFQKWAVKKSLE